MVVLLHMAFCANGIISDTCLVGHSLWLKTPIIPLSLV